MKWKFKEDQEQIPKTYGGSAEEKESPRNFQVIKNSTEKKTGWHIFLIT